MNNAVGAGDFGHIKRVIEEHALGCAFLLLVLLSVGTLLYTTVSWMLDTERLPLSKIVLQGELEYISSGDVQHALGSLDNLGTFMSQDVNELQTAITGLPWVARASIRKQWPDIIKVYLVEHKASAIWNGNSLLNETGDVFDADVGQLKEERIKLYGPAGSEHKVLQTWRKVEPLFSQLGLSLTSVVLNDRRAWQMILDNGIRLELGKESLDERLDRFISLYNRLGNKAAKVSYIDLRYDTGAAVGWFPEDDLAQESTDD
ncbi:cell division protein FtsQ/DivIB [Vibrio sp. JC009]|uniref:cell division protein FtsQ/DivIB n=1 Tax=Vibrio sp. JC009 TaxID=2912314 RepID=UPI0023B0CD75|nr:cell division protein FtsQ/DivIB [Vibrio sp. JC009]WED21428.1 cell division protein FtsQ/DivIB [Vibrio sp. JC009]